MANYHVARNCVARPPSTAYLYVSTMVLLPLSLASGRPQIGFSTHVWLTAQLGVHLFSNITPPMGHVTRSEGSFAGGANTLNSTWLKSAMAVTQPNKGYVRPSADRVPRSTYGP